MKPNVVYWSSVLVGFAVVVWLYWRSGGALAWASREGFADDTTTTTTTAPAAPAAPAPTPSTTGRLIQENGKYIYIENLADPSFPSRDALKVYLTSFSDKTQDAKSAVYSPADARWYNFVDPTMIFSLTSANGVPQTIRSQGVGIKNAVINGPSSAVFRDTHSSVPYELPAFSAVWFAKNVGLAASETQPGMMFKLFGQSPNYVEVYLRPAPDAPDALRLYAKIGDKAYEMSDAPIPATTLASGGNPTVYAFTYKKCSNTECSDGELTFYIGATAYTIPMIPAPTGPIVLANHNLQINTFANVDATLYAFAFYNTVLNASDVGKLGTYFAAELSNYNMTRMIADLLATENAAAAAAGQTAETQATDLAGQLAQCKLAASKLTKEETEAVQKQKWYIEAVNGSGAVSAADLEQCSLLKVARAAAPKAPAAPTTSPAAPATAPAAPAAPATAPAAPAAKAEGWWKIPYLEEMNGVTAKAPAAAPAEPTPAPKAPQTLWSGIYRQSLTQADKNLDAAKQTAADTGVTPVAGAVSLQDPAKTTAAAPIEEPGFFKQFADLFKQ